MRVSLILASAFGGLHEQAFLPAPWGRSSVYQLVVAHQINGVQAPSLPREWTDAPVGPLDLLPFLKCVL